MSKQYLTITLIVITICLAGFLRLFKLGTLPPSPYWEEVAVAYDAYSLLQTAKDHHGNLLPIVALESFGDWKPAGLAYVQTVSIFFLGLNVLALRLPVALAGLTVVAAVGFLSWKVTSSRLIAILGLFLAAVSPWQIIFSRGGWEVMLGTALFCWGAISIVEGESKIGKNRQLFLSLGALLLWVSAYTYHAFRLLVPIYLATLGIQVVLTLIFSRQKKYLKPSSFLMEVWKQLGILIGMSCILLIPFAVTWGTPQLGQRFSETSIFSNLDVITQSNTAIQTANYSLFARISNHRYVLFSRLVIDQYLSHFSPDFLFVTGDSNPRHNTGYGGQLNVVDSAFLLLGLLFLITMRPTKQQRVWTSFVLVLLVIAPIPASLTQAVPHALRSLPMSISLLVIASVGAGRCVHSLTNWLEKHHSSTTWSKSFVFGCVSLFIASVYSIQPIAWWRHYTFVYPKVAYQEWQYGYAELVAAVSSASEQNPDLPVYISRTYGRPAMYFWFYQKINPRLVQAVNEQTPKDQSEYLTFNSYRFVRSPTEIEGTPALIATTPSEAASYGISESDFLHQVAGPTGTIIWVVALLQ